MTKKKYLFVGVLILALLTVGSLQTSIKSINAIPGQTVTFDLTIRNDGESTRDYMLSYNAPSGFNGRFLVNGVEVKEISLSPYSSITVQFEVDVPDDLNEGIYNIWVSAGGQERLEINIVNVEKPLRITSSITGIKVEAGDEVSFPLNVENRLNAYYPVDLSCKVPEKWECRFFYGDNQVYKIVLGPKETRTIYFRVESDSSADVGEYAVKPILGKQSITLNIEITKTHKGENGVLILKVSDKDGKPVTNAEVKINNETFYTSGDGSALIEVPDGSYKVKISKDGYYDKEVDVEIKAGKEIEKSVLLEKKAYFVEISVSNPKITSIIGYENPMFRLKIENIGYADGTYTLSVSGLPENFYARFKESADSPESISEVFIKGGESKDVYLEVIVPPRAKVGTYNLTVHVEGYCSATKNLTLNLKGEYRVYFEPVGGRYLIISEPGAEVKYQGLLRNTGIGADITNIEISVDAPEGWKVNVDPSSSPALKAGDFLPINIQAKIPPNTIPSEYKLKLKIKSDQLEETEEIKVVVREKSFSWIIGGIVILSAVVLLVVIFRKFGRR